MQRLHHEEPHPASSTTLGFIDELRHAHAAALSNTMLPRPWLRLRSACVDACSFRRAYAAGACVSVLVSRVRKSGQRQSCPEDFSNRHQSPLGTTCSTNDTATTAAHFFPFKTRRIASPAACLIERLCWPLRCAVEGAGWPRVAREEHRGRI